MKRRRIGALKVSGEDARRALQVLISEGKIAARDVVQAIERREKLIREIRERLAALGADGLHWASQAARGARLPAVASSGRRARRAGTRRAKRVLSAATRAAYQAQGRYMAAVRALSKAARVKIKAIRGKSGVDAAIRAAKAMAKK